MWQNRAICLCTQGSNDVSIMLKVRVLSEYVEDIPPIAMHKFNNDMAAVSKSPVKRRLQEP